MAGGKFFSELLFLLWVSGRFLLGKKQRAQRVIGWFSVGGVMLGVAALLISVSVMNGMKAQFLEAIQSTTPDARILRKDNLPMSQEEQDKLKLWLKRFPQVLAHSPYTSQQVFFKGEGGVSPAFLRGIDPLQEKGVSDLEAFLHFPFGEKKELLPPPTSGKPAGVVLGFELAQSLGVFLGDKVLVISPFGRPTPLGYLPSWKSFEVQQILYSGLAKNDSFLAFAHILSTQRLFRQLGKNDGLALKLEESETLPPKLVAELPEVYQLIGWQEGNRNLFQAMELEKVGLFLILFLIVVVSLNNIGGAQMVMVLEKRREIAMLRLLGGNVWFLFRVFLLQGLALGLFGVLGGLLLGFGAFWFLLSTDFFQLPLAVVALERGLPLKIDSWEVAFIAGGTLLAATLAGLPPALKAAWGKPLKNL